MSAPVYDRWGVQVHQGDCLDVLRTMAANSAHAIVTDPPYGLEFMGKEWDSFNPGGKRPGFGKPDGSKFRQNMGTPSWGASGNPTCRNCGGDKYRNGPRKCGCDTPDFGNHSGDHNRAFQAWSETWARECLRVLKPGGYMLAFGGTRTWHRLVCGIEDAGFEIRDSIAWTYGSGFPKSLDVSKAIDRAAGAEREIVGTRLGRPGVSKSGANQGKGFSRLLEGRSDRPDPALDLTAPATDAARQWEGWGTALKPSHEPIIVARRPLSSTVARSVLEYGTGALNIGACRIGTDTSRGDRYHGKAPGGSAANGWGYEHSKEWVTPAGRWPSNVVLTHSPLLDPATGEVLGDACADGCVEGCAVAELDTQSGVLTSGLFKGNRTSDKTRNTYGAFRGDPTREAETYGDSGGASRFFPSFRWEAKAPAAERPKVNGRAHPTVKPVSLMRWMVRLCTPPGGTVLDLFAGTGTTGQAARAEGLKTVLIENDPESIPLIVARLDALPKTEAPCGSAPTEWMQLDLFSLGDEAAS